MKMVSRLVVIPSLPLLLVTALGSPVARADEPPAGAAPEPGAAPPAVDYEEPVVSPRPRAPAPPLFSFGLPAPSTPPPSAPSRSYGLQILASDAASVGAIIGGIVVDSAGGASPGGALMLVGFGGTLLGGPVVHAAHGEWLRGGASLGLRILLPSVAATVAYSTAGCSKDAWLCGVGEMFLGYAAGAVSAMAIDAIFLARHAPSPEPETRRAQPKLALAPSVAVTPNMASVGLGGRF